MDSLRDTRAGCMVKIGPSREEGGDREGKKGEPGPSLAVVLYFFCFPSYPTSVSFVSFLLYLPSVSPLLYLSFISPPSVSSLCLVLFYRTAREVGEWGTAMAVY